MDYAERARKFAKLIRSALGETRQNVVAPRMDTSETKISTLKNGPDIETISALIAACDLKVVPANFVCEAPETIYELERTAERYYRLKRRLRAQETAAADATANGTALVQRPSWDDY